MYGNSISFTIAISCGSVGRGLGWHFIGRRFDSPDVHKKMIAFEITLTSKELQSIPEISNT